MASPMRPLNQVLITIALLAVGAAFTYWVGLPVYQKSRDSASWPHADGRIVASRVDSQVEGNKTRYSAHVEFTYEVNGQRHSSNWIWPTGASSSTTAPPQHETIARYPEGKEVKVYYDPESPTFGVLEPGVTGTTYFILGAGIAIMLAGLLMAVVTGFQLRSSKAR